LETFFNPQGRNGGLADSEAVFFYALPIIVCKYMVWKGRTEGRNVFSRDRSKFSFIPIRLKISFQLKHKLFCSAPHGEGAITLSPVLGEFPFRLIDRVKHRIADNRRNAHHKVAMPVFLTKQGPLAEGGLRWIPVV
jgi:hypothetical protein